MDTVVLNVGLELAIEFGKNWLKPIQERLGARYPELTQTEVDEYNAICQAAMRFGNAELSACWREANSHEATAFRLFGERVHERYSWVSDEMMSRLFSQGCYYAWKNGEPS